MKVRHGTVYFEEGKFASHPANHGAWQWGDELLFGFLRGDKGSGLYHNIVEPFEKVLARSLDGGETWVVEVPNVDFEAATIAPPPELDLSKAIIRICGCYDTGGDHCHDRGGFYVSQDKGKTWTGAFEFAGLEKYFAKPFTGTARTRVLGDLIFLSARYYAKWGTDYVFCARHDGKEFKFVSVVCDDDCRAVMPAAARIGDRIVVVIRRKGLRQRGGWIDAFASPDNGESWRFLTKVGDTGTWNGNPPALATSGGKVFCAYANRSKKKLMLSVSSDAGATWTEGVLRDGGDRDIGYPQMFVRSDGALVCIYYWEDAGGHRGIQSSIIQ